MLDSDRVPAAKVMFRLPHAEKFTVLVQHAMPSSYDAIASLPSRPGYVIAPFRIAPESPLWLVEPDEIMERQLPQPPVPSMCLYTTDESEQRAAYHDAFMQVHRLLCESKAEKIVLSRQLNVQIDADSPALVPEHLFYKACRYAPNSFVALWHIRPAGYWLVATPEPLLERRSGYWHTVALAGTMPWEEKHSARWDCKNREEQAIVARFIAAQLSRYADEFRQSEPYTLRAGNIRHLCTDFIFSLPSGESVPALLQSLHPTPAVCGLPREQARRAIVTYETAPRLYYAGFSGPLDLCGNTSLYVSLRCMHFGSHCATLHAGGGIMPTSTETAEWVETQRKMHTMMQLF